jgi:phosphatidylserine decarboxylase
MKFINEWSIFLRAFKAQSATVGAFMPTARFAARAMCSACAAHTGPKRVLEVGAGTGAITREIVRHIGSVDAFVVVELEPTLAEFLRKRFAVEPHFAQARAQSQVLQQSILDLPTTQQFDYIISAIPFNNCQPQFVESVFTHYKALLRPSGVLSYIEYIGGRWLKLRLTAGANIRGVNAIVVRQLHAHEFRRDVVWRNAPPAWVHHLRF